MLIFFLHFFLSFYHVIWKRSAIICVCVCYSSDQNKFKDIMSVPLRTLYTFIAGTRLKRKYIVVND